MTTAELFVRCLEAEGVETIFGVPGEENLDLLDALLDSGTSQPPSLAGGWYAECEAAAIA